MIILKLFDYIEDIDRRLTKKILDYRKERQRIARKRNARKEIFLDLFFNSNKYRKQKDLETGRVTYIRKGTQFVPNTSKPSGKFEIYKDRKRFVREKYVNDFTYLVTFTYDSEKMTERKFKKRLIKCLNELCKKNKWKYIGAFHKGRKGRLYFSGLVYIMFNRMIGEFKDIESYSYERHNIVITSQNTYFYEEFGLNIFEPIKIEKIPYFLKSLALSEEIYFKGIERYLILDIRYAKKIMDKGESVEDYFNAE